MHQALFDDRDHEGWCWSACGVVASGDPIRAAGADAPPIQGVDTIRIHANPLQLAAQSADDLFSAATAAWRSVIQPGRALRLLSWSGTLAPSLFQADPRTWMAPGRQALDALCDRIGPILLQRRWTLCFQPHARHVLSDVRSCREFLAQRIGQPFELALSPATMLERSMLPAIDDHLERLFEGLGPSAALIILEDVLEEADENGLPRRDDYGRGLLPRALVAELLRRHVPADVPVVARGSDRG